MSAEVGLALSARLRRALAVACALVVLGAPLRSVLGKGFQLVSTVGFGDELESLGISHHDPNFVMVGAANGKLHRTIDGGATWQEITMTPYRSLFYGRERHDDPRLEYALGLPGKSPLLQRWLRSKGLRTSGVNMQQLLVLKGDKAVAIDWIEVDWHDENRVFLGTIDGLYRSVDKGRTFLRIWQGRSGLADRFINTVATDPFNPRTLMVGTADGLFVSQDRGNTFRKEMNYYIRDSQIRGLYFDPQFKGLVHMAMGGAAMASPDAGKNWITTYWNLWAPRSDVQWISLGPNNIRAIATRDGIFASDQGGEFGTWKRRGLRFVGLTVSKVMVTRNPKIWYALTEHAAWRSDDSGVNWHRVLLLGGNEYPKWIDAYHGDPDRVWLLTNRRVYRMGLPKRARPEAPRQRAPQRTVDLPPLSVFWLKVIRNKHLYWGDNQGYRNRSPLASLLPLLSVNVNLDRSRDVRNIRMYPYIYWPYLYFNAADDHVLTFEVLASWDLSRLVFDRRQLPHFGRIERSLEYERRDLSERVYRLYVEYERVAHRMTFRPAADLMVREFDHMRLQEIAAYFDAISGGYWSKATGGVP